jgi:hypothetical protein
VISNAKSRRSVFLFAVDTEVRDVCGMLCFLYLNLFVFIRGLNLLICLRPRTRARRMQFSNDNVNKL